MKRQIYPDRKQLLLSPSLAIFTFLLACVALICHTGHLHGSSQSQQIPSRAHSYSVPSGDREVEADEPCLNCMFLYAINAMQISLFAFMPLSGIMSARLCLPQAESLTSDDSVSAFQSRSPPSYFLR